MENEELATVEMIMSDEMATTIKDAFDLEIEMLQGKWELEPDGRVKWTIKVNQEKGQMIKDFMLKIMFKEEPNFN